MARATEEDNSLGFYTSPDLASLAGEGEKGKTAAQNAAADAAATTVPLKQLNKMTADEVAAAAQARLDAIKQNRLTGGGTEPPSPAEPGTHWSFIGGQWKLYKDFSPTTDTTKTTGTGAADTKTTSTSTTTQTANQVAERQNIFDQLTALFTTYGVIKAGDPASDALLKTMKDLAMSGAGSDTISLALQQSDAYKTRFAGNETRRAAGLSVLSPAEYIATEKAYDQVLHAAGVPTGFYRGTGEMAKLIGADVSPTELQTRVDLAAKSISDADPFYTQQLQNFYGLSQGDMIAHVLDPAVAAPLIQKQVSTATVGAAAARNATNVNLSTAEQLAGMGISQAQAEQGFGNIAAQLPSMQAIASRYQGFGAASQVGQELQSATFNAPIGGLTAAQSEQMLKRLQTQESSAFGGSAGAAKGSLLGSEEGVQ
jgi:hypothetical protein